MKYNVKKTEQKWPYEIIENYGELTIEEIEKMGIGLIGDVFNDMDDVKTDMAFIEETSGESWFCNGYDIDITAVKE